MDIEKHHQPGTPGQPRLNDEDRAATAGKLQQAVGHGQLSLEDYIHRLDRAYQATSHAALAALTEDLARPVGSLPVSVPSSVAIFDDVVRTGPWQLPPHSKATAVFGDVELDLRQAATTDAEICIEVTAVFGNVRITVPEGIEVLLEADAVLSHSHSCALAPVPRQPGAPLIRVHPVGWFGSVHIESRTPDQPRLSTPWQENRQRRRMRRGR
jgi:hypothetical protein